MGMLTGFQAITQKQIKCPYTGIVIQIICTLTTRYCICLREWVYTDEMNFDVVDESVMNNRETHSGLYRVTRERAQLQTIFRGPKRADRIVLQTQALCEIIINTETSFRIRRRPRR